MRHRSPMQPKGEGVKWGEDGGKVGVLTPGDLSPGSQRNLDREVRLRRQGSADAATHLWWVQVVHRRR
jgi:hypothetical protein